MLDKIVTGRVKKPAAVLLYGVEGVGKSTFAAGAENPIFLGGEQNDELNVARFPVLKSYDEFIEALKSLIEQGHDYKTLVIDTIDSIEALLWQDIRGTGSMATAMGGFGKAYENAAERLEKMRDVLLNRLRDERGMQIVILSHAAKIKFEDPMTNLSYDTYEVKLHKKSRPLFFEWASAVLFANFETLTTNKEGGKEYAVGQGKRIMYTSKRPAYEAKNRFNLPQKMPLNWKAFKNGFNAFYDEGKAEDTREIINEILALVREHESKLPAKAILEGVEKSEKDAAELYRIKNKIQKIIGG